jgi:hypothetical protein
MRFVRLLILLAICLSGCADFPGRCELALAHHDCPEGQVFPSDEAACRSYGLTPGTAAFQKCRAVKASVYDQTKTSINAGWIPTAF